MRGAVTFILKGYPRLSETFIAQEIKALEGRGLAIEIVSLRRPTDPYRHPIHDEIKAPVVYLPEYQSINRFPHPLRHGVLELVDKLAIDRIDLFGTFIADHDPSRLFALGKRGGHYSAAGYDLVYRAIRDYLSGGPPSKK